NVVGISGTHIPQQIGIDGMLGMLPRELWTGINRLQPHLVHIRTHGIARKWRKVWKEERVQLPRTIEWALREEFVNAMFDRNFTF
ncbi:MAG TPA: hypothetical protein PLX65_14555, partial [Accumulibacter sp.]|nr:hypothetical protein [Accumulibacter sp.]